MQISCVIWQGEIKVANQQTLRESCDLRKTQLAMADFEMEEEDMSQGMQAASGNWILP